MEEGRTKSTEEEGGREEGGGSVVLGILRDCGCWSEGTEVEGGGDRVRPVWTSSRICSSGDHRPSIHGSTTISRLCVWVCGCVGVCGGGGSRRERERELSRVLIHACHRCSTWSGRTVTTGPMFTLINHTPSSRHR